MKKILYFLFLLQASTVAYCSDLDGNVPSGDEPISDELQVNPNVEFIRRNVKSKVSRGTGETNKLGGVGNITSSCTKNCTILNESVNKGAAAIGGR